MFLRLIPIIILFFSAPAFSVSINGFELDNASIPVTEIFHGGPPRDGIPSIDAPQFERAEQAPWNDTDPVVGLTLGGISKAYPIGILNWHEIVNDHFGETPVVVSYCPLCGSAMAFDRRLDGQTVSFGVSGLRHNSDVLMYDRETDSLWSQIMAEAVTGVHKGRHLTQVPLTLTTWKRWREAHPDTLVLSQDTGMGRNYQRNPYAGYEQVPDTMFPVSFRAKGLHPKERVLGLNIGGEQKAWPFSALAQTASPVEDRLGGQLVRIEHDIDSGTVQAFGENAELLNSVVLFWFAWSAFHPDTALFSAP